MAEDIRRMLEEALRRIEDLGRRLERLERRVERRLPPRPAVGIPFTPPEVAMRRCMVCGDEFLGPSDETIWYLTRILPFPREYWLTCPECIEPRFGWRKHKEQLEICLETIAPVYREWVSSLIDMLP